MMNPLIKDKFEDSSLKKSLCCRSRLDRRNTGQRSCTHEVTVYLLLEFCQLEFIYFPKINQLARGVTVKSGLFHDRIKPGGYAIVFFRR